MKISGVAEKSMLTSSTVAVFQTRVVLRNRLVIVNKLVADLHFWNEVQKYLHLRKKNSRKKCDQCKCYNCCYLVKNIVALR